MIRDLARSIDPSLWLSDAGYQPDAWQARALRSAAKRQLWLTGRQVGKSLTASAKAIAQACGEAGSLVVCVSASQKQSSEWLRSTRELYLKIPGLAPIIGDSANKLELHGGSRILSMPSSESSVRGWAGVQTLILDECSRIENPIIEACLPFLATTNGSIVALTTPASRSGMFYEWWTSGEGWEKEEIPASQCKRIDPAWLEDQRKQMGPRAYAAEFECQFLDDEQSLFSTSLIESMFRPEIAPLW